MWTGYKLFQDCEFTADFAEDARAALESALGPLGPLSGGCARHRIQPPAVVQTFTEADLSPLYK